MLTWDVQVSGLDSNITMGHIHGPWTPPSASAGVILNFAPSTQIPTATFTGIGTKSGHAQGSLTLGAANVGSSNVSGDSLAKFLLTGRAYVNVHTAKNPAGEVRAQIKP